MYLLRLDTVACFRKLFERGSVTTVRIVQNQRSPQSLTVLSRERFSQLGCFSDSGYTSGSNDFSLHSKALDTTLFPFGSSGQQTVSLRFTTDDFLSADVKTDVHCDAPNAISVDNPAIMIFAILAGGRATAA